MFFKKKETTENRNKITEFGDRLLQGDAGCLSWLYEQLVYEDAKGCAIIADYIKRFMSELDTVHLIRLDERFRDTSSMEWYTGWKNVDPEKLVKSVEDREAAFWILRLGTFHPNGYFREKCVRKLIGDKASVPFLLLRLNDWARVVRTIAGGVAYTVKRLSVEEIIASLPYLEKVEHGFRRDYGIIESIKESMAVGIANGIRDFDLKKVRYYELSARRQLYRFIYETQALDKSGVRTLIDLEKNSQLQAQLLSGYINKYEVSLEELDRFIDHKSEVVQRLAIEHKYSRINGIWDGLEQKLISSSAGLRSSVRYLLQMKSDIDIRQYYLDRIDTAARGICILGLGETGKESDADLLMKYLESDNAGTVKKTLHALGMLKGDKAEEVFWKYLHDERQGVMCQAYREISAANIRYKAKNIYDLFEKTDSLELKRKLAARLAREEYWDRLPYILKLYSHEDEIIRDRARYGLKGVNMYGRISTENAEWIREILAEDSCKVPERLKTVILFNLKHVCNN